MPYKDPKNPKNIAYKKAYYLKRKNELLFREQRKKAFKKWRQNNKFKLNKYSRNRYDPIKDKIRREKIAAIEAKKFKKKVDDLSSQYLIKKLVGAGYTRDNLKKNPEIIDTYKIQLKIKRLIKQKTK